MSYPDQTSFNFFLVLLMEEMNEKIATFADDWTTFLGSNK